MNVRSKIFCRPCQNLTDGNNSSAVEHGIAVYQTHADSRIFINTGDQPVLNIFGNSFQHQIRHDMCHIIAKHYICRVEAVNDIDDPHR